MHSNASINTNAKLQTQSIHLWFVLQMWSDNDHMWTPPSKMFSPSNRRKCFWFVWQNRLIHFVLISVALNWIPLDERCEMFFITRKKRTTCAGLFLVDRHRQCWCGPWFWTSNASGSLPEHDFRHSHAHKSCVGSEKRRVWIRIQVARVL